MNSLPTVPAASNAVPAPSAVRPAAPRTRDRYPEAHRACKSHPAYTHTAAIAAALEHLLGLCERFGETYTPDTIANHLVALGLDCDEVSTDFEVIHEDVTGLAWMLNTVRGSITTAMVLPFDERTTGAKKGGAA